MELYVYDNGPDWMHYKIWVKVPGCTNFYKVDGTRVSYYTGYKEKEDNRIQGHSVKRIQTLDEVQWQEDSKQVAAALLTRISAVKDVKERLLSAKNELAQIAKQQAELRRASKEKRLAMRLIKFECRKIALGKIMD